MRKSESHLLRQIGFVDKLLPQAETTRQDALQHVQTNLQETMGSRSCSCRSLTMFLSQWTVVYTLVAQSWSFGNLTCIESVIARQDARHTWSSALNPVRSKKRFCAMQPWTSNSSFSASVCGSKLLEPTRRPASSLKPLQLLSASGFTSVEVVTMFASLAHQQIIDSQPVLLLTRQARQEYALSFVAGLRGDFLLAPHRRIEGRPPASLNVRSMACNGMCP